MKKFGVCFIIILTVMSVFGLPFSFAREEGMDELDISLGELLALDKVLVTATKHAMTSRKAPAINTVITANEIRNMGARNLIDILRIVPGLNVTKNAVWDALAVRGLYTSNTEKILFLVDGHRMIENYTGSGYQRLCSDLPVENIKQVEVIRGPGSALYGANAFVAVINIITKSAEDIGTHQSTIGMGSFDTVHYNGLFGFKKDDFEISCHVDLLDSDGQSLLIEEDPQTVWDENRGTNSSLAPGDTREFKEKLDAGLKLKYNDFTFFCRSIEKEMGTSTGAIGALNDESVGKIKLVLGDLTWRREITDNSTISANLYGDLYDMDIYWQIRPKGFTGGNDIGLIGNPMLKNRIVGGEVSADYRFGNHLATFGMVHEHVKQYDVKQANNFANPTKAPVFVPYEGRFCDNVSRDVWAGYFQNIWEITQQDTLTLGVRYDHYDDYGGTTNPRVGYVHEFSNNLVVKALYGSAFRAPNFQELYIRNNPTRTGNPDLKPEKIATYELGLEWPFHKYFSASVNAFHNVIQDTISTTPPVDGPGDTINSDGEVKLSGFEAELSVNLEPGKYGYLNCSYQDGEDNEENSLVNVANWKINAGLNYEIFKYLNANVNVSWIGERMADEGRENVSSNTLVDVALIAKEFHENLEISGSIHNLFDEDYREYAALLPNDMPNNERMFLVEIRYGF